MFQAILPYVHVALLILAHPNLKKTTKLKEEAKIFKNR
jgi:hypothetical protein